MKNNDAMRYFEFDEAVDWVEADDDYWENLDEDYDEEDDDGEVHWLEMSYYRHPERMSLDDLTLEEGSDEDDESLWR